MTGRLVRAALVLGSGWIAIAALALGAAGDTNVLVQLGPVATAGAAVAAVSTPWALHSRCGGVAVVVTIHGVILMLLGADIATPAVVVAGNAALIHVLSAWTVRDSRLGTAMLTRLIPGALVTTLVASVAVLAPRGSPWVSLAAPILAVLAVVSAIGLTYRHGRTADSEPVR